MKRTSYVVLNVLFPLIVGFFCYLLLRPEAFVTKMLFHYTGIWISLNSEVVYSNFILRVLNNHFADFLWAFSMAHILFAYGCFIKWNKGILLVICVLTGITMEFILGTFDIFDILVQWIAISIVYLKYNSIMRKWRR